MDKYEYRLKAEQIEKLVKKQDYKTAAKIADTIDWRRVKNLNMLYIVSEIYEAMERYEDCMEILNIAYDRAPVGRMLLYKMTEIATRMHNFEEAIGLYREFVKAAPHDQSRYILKYQIYRERGSSLEDQIRILRDYKAHEYQEKWAYELASLYAEAGYTEDCVRECDELILWFSEGEYVIKAMELKMQYEPLTAAQQDKYDHRLRPSGGAGVHEDDFEETEVEFSADKFSTMNLQAELAANLGELLQEDATIQIPTLEIEEASQAAGAEQQTDISESVTVPEIEFESLELPEEPGKEGPKAAVREEPKSEKVEEKAESFGFDIPEISFESLELPEEPLKEEPEAVVKEEPKAEEPQIENAEEKAESFGFDIPEISFESLELPEEPLKEEPGAVVKEEAKAEEPQIEKVEEKAESFGFDIPEISFESLELPEASEKEELKADEPQIEKAGEKADSFGFDIPEISFESLELPEEPLKEEPKESEKEEPEAVVKEEPQTEKEEELVEKQITGQMTIDEILAEWENKKAETEAILEANAGQEQVRKEKVKQETAELMKLISGVSEVIPEDVQQILEEMDKDKQPLTVPLITEDDLPKDLDEPEEPEDEGGEISFEDLDAPEEPAPVKRERVSQDTTSMNMIQELERSLAAEVSEMAVNAGHLTKEQARLFAYFTSVKGMSQQLSVLFKEEEKGGRTNSSRGNLVVTGKQGNGKTTLAIDIVKALQRQKRIEGKRLAKISGQKLNSRDIYEVISKLKGGALIIESAGGLSEASMMALSLAMESDTGGLLVILEDSAEEIQRIFHKNRNFASKFDHTIDIPVFTNDELVAFGKSYALEAEYVFDEFGVLALYDKIGSRQTNDHMVTVAEVKDIIDAAIAHAEKGSVRHLFAKLAKKNVDEFGNHLLREEDFDEA